ncbi:hypothetical protein NE865_00175 [Phthorimaea operculella]|nr:hypothetical protein NE865_00175 [Phthorimaea operculella]
MLNILSYIGVSLQSELCLWTLIGLIRTIFDATLFKVNANLKQVWQMTMPPQLSLPVQQATRTVISGVMLVQCFTVYVYLASYIVLLYPIFLEERPTLVLPWLLLAAIRSFLCELTSLALGLGACVLLGAARPPCIKFVVFKVASIMPAFYMWMLVFCYYNILKVAAAYKLSTTLSMMPSDHNYGLELAVRRRRTKSLQDEEQLRKNLVAKFGYGERSESVSKPLKGEGPVRMAHSTHADLKGIEAEVTEPIILTPLAVERKSSDSSPDEDWIGSEIIVPRDSDRILEQFSVMMLRIAVWMGTESSDPRKMFSSFSTELVKPNKNENSSPIQETDRDASPSTSNMKNSAPYLQNYPQIFKTKPTDRQNTATTSQSHPTKIENAEEFIDKTINERIIQKEKYSAEKAKTDKNINDNISCTSSEIIKKWNMETTTGIKKCPEQQTSDTQQSVSSQNNCKLPSTRKPTETLQSHVNNKKLKPSDEIKTSDSHLPPPEDRVSKVDKMENREVSSKEQTSNHKDLSQSSTLETVQERIKTNVALLQEQQQQQLQQNKNTDLSENQTEGK